MWPGEWAFLRDQIDLLADIANLELDLALLERRHRSSPDLADEFADMRHRLGVVRAHVREQVDGLSWRVLGETTRDVVPH